MSLQRWLYQYNRKEFSHLNLSKNLGVGVKDEYSILKVINLILTKIWLKKFYWELLKGSYDCRCRNGFEGNGYKCTPKDVDECMIGNHKCDKYAKCTNTVGSYICTCNSGNYFLIQNLIKDYAFKRYRKVYQLLKITLQ